MCYYRPDELPVREDVAAGHLRGVKIDPEAKEPYILIEECYSDIYGRKYSTFTVYLTKDCVFEEDNGFCRIWSCGTKKVYVCPSRTVYQPSDAWIE